jgi:hypothetical protein
MSDDWSTTIDDFTDRTVKAVTVGKDQNGYDYVEITIKGLLDTTKPELTMRFTADGYEAWGTITSSHAPDQRWRTDSFAVYSDMKPVEDAYIPPGWDCIEHEEENE